MFKRMFINQDGMAFAEGLFKLFLDQMIIMKRCAITFFVASVLIFQGWVSDAMASQQSDSIFTSASVSKNLKHKVVKGDTWYSIARKYNTTYADLRLANKERSDALKIGDIIMIPGSVPGKYDPEKGKVNTSQEKKSAPVKKFHTVKSGDNMTALAKKYGVTVKQLEAWNHLKSKHLKAGQKLVVGVSEEKPKQETVKMKKEPVPLITHDTTAPVLTKVVVSADTSIKHKDSASTKITRTADALDVAKKSEETFAKGRREVTEEGLVAWIEDSEINPGKYFALHRTAPVGTIMKVTNRMNHRTVFVKVVGKLPDTGDNENLLLKISKVAADKLGVLDTRFQAQLNYGVAAQ
jgi:LysM repeat protein